MTKEFSEEELSKVAALHQKRTVAFANHFIITTIQFVNHFMRKCEFQLMQFESKLDKVNASLVLLEARLSSIPDIQKSNREIKEDQIDHASTTNDEKTEELVTSKVPSDVAENVSSIDDTNLSVEHNTADESKDYEKFVKMFHVGVPLEAVKLQVSLEGLDPDILQKILK